MEGVYSSLDIAIVESNEYSVFSSESTSKKIEIGLFERFINFIISLFFSPKKSESLDGVRLLPTTANKEIFERYVGSLSHDLDQIESLLNKQITKDFENPQAKAMDALAKCELMKNQAIDWMVSHTEYNYTNFLPVLEKASKVRLLAMTKLVTEHFLSHPAPLTPEDSSFVNPGMTNQGNTCYLASLFQGLLGDPICRRLIINSLPNNSIDQNVNHFVQVLQECAIEFDKAVLSGETRPLNFLAKLREALNPLVSQELLGFLIDPQQDPSEILIEILNCIQKANNPLFSQQVRNHVYQVSQEAEEKLTNGLQATLAFQHILAGLNSENKETFIIELKNYLLSINPKADIVALKTTDDVLKEILCQFVEVSKGEYEARLLPEPGTVSQGRLTEIKAEIDTKFKANQALLQQIRQVDSIDRFIDKPGGGQVSLKEWLHMEIKAHLDVPQMQGDQWIRTAPLNGERNAVFTVTLAGAAKDNTFMSYFEKDYSEKSQGVTTTFFPQTSFATDIPMTQTKTQFVQPPEHLFIQLSRHDGLGNKLNKQIDLDETFDLDSKFVQSREGGKYQIRWFTVHIGGSKGGHYVHYRKCFDGNQERWFLFNDGLAPRRVEEGELKRALGNSTLFFASKVTTEN